MSGHLIAMRYLGEVSRANRIAILCADREKSVDQAFLVAHGN